MVSSINSKIVSASCRKNMLATDTRTADMNKYYGIDAKNMNIARFSCHPPVTASSRKTRTN
jgi:hypothetical protein